VQFLNICVVETKVFCCPVSNEITFQIFSAVTTITFKFIIFSFLSTFTVTSYNSKYYLGKTDPKAF